MSYHINTTESYHREKIDGLGWELTVCNSLWPEHSPCRRVLRNGNSYGTMLYRFLEKLLPMETVTSVLEGGGGYGYLMKDFLDIRPTLRTTMLDISPMMLKTQKETLAGHDVLYLEADFLRSEPVMLGNYDLVILNENLGDFPVVVNISRDDYYGANSSNDETMRAVRHIHDKCNLPDPEDFPCTFNLGAVQAVELICVSGVRFAFISEHSCEAEAPSRLSGLIGPQSSGNPERIRLRGHDEYMVKFSHLERTARKHGYTTLRGPMADFLTPLMDGEVRFILSSGVSARDDHEILRQFIGDLYKYEYLILLRNA